MDRERVEELIKDLSRPTFLVRMHRNNPRGHDKVRDQALAEVDRIVSEYCASKPKEELCQPQRDNPRQPRYSAHG